MLEEKRQIVAIGGGGLAAERDDHPLEEYVLQLAGKPRPRVCFVPTASGDAQGYVDRFYQTCAALPCEPCHLSLFRGETEDIRSVLLSQDVIYVGGGNTRNMLVLWREWGVDSLVREAWERGIVLAGWSAGSICWFEQGVTDSVPGRLSVLPCLGFLPGSTCPHFDAEPERRPAYRRFLASGEILPGYAADDEVGLHFRGRELVRVVSGRREARAYFCERVEGSVRETVLEPDFRDRGGAGGK